MPWVRRFPPVWWSDCVCLPNPGDEILSMKKKTRREAENGKEAVQKGEGVNESARLIKSPKKKKKKEEKKDTIEYF